MPQIRLRNPSPTVIADSIDLPTSVPDLPDDVFKRFPSLRDWQEDTDRWWTRAVDALQTQNRVVSQSVTKANSQTGDLRVSFNNFTAEITTEIDAIVNEQGAQARRIVTVSAMAGVSQNIKIQNTPPGAPAIGDFWLDNSDLALVVTYQWSGAAWVEVTDPITAAGVADERTARVTADGYLEGKYSLTVIAGNVVTGMNITSASGPGTNISSVIFRATDFQIYNGTTGKVMFNVSGSDVQLAGTLTVSTSGKVYIGTGTYGNSNTAWYVDSAGQFSLKDKLTWDGTTLTVSGEIRLSSAASPSGAGLFLGSDFLGYYNGSAWKTYMDNAGHFYLGGTSGALQWDGTTLNVTGNINVVSISGLNYAGAGSPGGAANSIVGQGSLATQNSAAWSTQVSGVPVYLTDGRIAVALTSSGGVVLGVNASPSGSGLFLGSDYLGYYSSGSWRTYMDNSGNFFLSGTSGHGLSWNAGTNTLSITGDVNALSGTVGGFALSSTTLSATNVLLDSGNAILAVGPSGYEVKLQQSGGVGELAIYYASSVVVELGTTATTSFLTLSGTATIYSTALNSSGPIRAPDGSASAPGYSFSNETNTGIYHGSSGHIDFATSGAARFTVRDAAVVCLVPLKLDNAFVAGAPAATGYVTLQDSSGTTYKVLVG